MLLRDESAIPSKLGVVGVPLFAVIRCDSLIDVLPNGKLRWGHATIAI
jgi:hypothetical protein